MDVTNPIKIEVESVELKNNNKEEIKREINASLRRALTKCGQIAERYAKDECPVRTSRLKNSISNGLYDDNGEVCAIVGTNVEYAPYVELGARGRKPRHFLKNSVTEHVSEYENILADYLKN